MGTKTLVRAGLSGGLILLAAVAALSSLAGEQSKGAGSKEAPPEVLGGALKAEPSAQLFIASPAAAAAPQPVPTGHGQKHARQRAVTRQVSSTSTEHHHGHEAAPSMKQMGGADHKKGFLKEHPHEGKDAGAAKQAALKRLLHKSQQERASESRKAGKKSDFSTKWERSADDAFFDSLDKHRESDEHTRLKQLEVKSEDEDHRQAARLKAEHEKIAREEEQAKLRFGREQAKAKAYTKKTFAEMADHQQQINKGSLTGFKGLEAKELAEEIERDHPNESAKQIAARALNLLHVVLHQQPSLPSTSLSVGQNPLHP
mmetsp:Transcript_5305/g.8491  ORF Transcript_5305/g.8491 Transcript_5305/m.8491 type:complete len:315 (+) Transcript_5305:449-1393(+)|eukprot:CAMPEP_0184306906 /NCGR_PEP_ID=MMETSP1049-20130417/15780_1 /TAXON_ID=77928 /ORGANISM="Proteomonas sulcata, Strain CCMP704" /LENGTH=314 /DNA_ID=CAMNT_0026619269 /DNA_START=439 /DNA_END=1383 /DNA_ORIENTATION=-